MKSCHEADELVEPIGENETSTLITMTADGILAVMGLSRFSLCCGVPYSQTLSLPSNAGLRSWRQQASICSSSASKGGV